MVASKSTAGPDPAAAFIDCSDFTRRGARLSGDTTPGAFPRLLSLLSDEHGQLHWSLTGQRVTRSDGGSDGWLNLELTGRVGMQCLRCLNRVDADIDVKRRFLLVSDEALADKADAESDEFDVLVADKRFDLAALIEDEAIMALPISPRHGQCSLPAAEAGGDPVPAQPAPAHPFAGLAALRPSLPVAPDEPGEAPDPD